MRTTILSVAHAPQSKGATFGAFSEYALSREITGRVADLLEASAYPVEAFNVGKNHPDWDYTGKVLPAKAGRVNSTAYAVSRWGQECLAVELHFNTAGTAAGTAVLFARGSTVGERCARVTQDVLLQLLERGQHWTGDKDGLIEVPGLYYADEPNKTLTFLHETTCPAIIVELDAMRAAPWFDANVDAVSWAVFEALQKAAEV